ncbi:MAG: hypothetical protein CL866_00305 [Cycloclasticus sp.]|jgi:hypothetical protein|uniref:Uncharacterized protein n=1 Tax=Cycloclasticus pugetii TaxID=34068 RepID=A0AB33Z183_9GAMM|nr:MULTISPECIES: hypothetical protein [Cycloclasticus]KXJ57945.1 MAG: hypothetical protein AXW17_12670 [Colwellia sp. Phe_37]HAI96372.1 hypothetical protein [Methylococcaceae bacterium]ATI03239.1 hypothetical protein CPC19_07075 [Cycloclasticus sp. PY97N]EPD12682.1 hypothetical protein L196_08754 [Cycloclasticus pugetii]MAV29823.1 hypothetical protein [Cycloclasticus sp.]|tara:strand:+ start:1870 stop:2259 length:390 start_codon:yes stop_codon:yes gene_type:complete
MKNNNFTISYKINPTDFPQASTSLELKKHNNNWVLKGVYGMYSENEVNRIISEDEVQAVITKLEHSKLPVLPSEIVGCDGAFQEIKLARGVGHIIYRWWDDELEGYKVLDKLVDTLLEWGRIDYGKCKM